MTDLKQLAELIRQKNATDIKIASVIGRPALMGHVGEYIAKCVFDLDLNESASNKTTDGHFRSGPLAGKSVNVKWIGKREGLLDVGTIEHPDYYLVLAGPRWQPSSSRGSTRPWTIAAVYLFDAERLAEQLTLRGVRVGIATSIRVEQWAEAEIYPQASATLPLSSEQRSALELFGP